MGRCTITLVLRKALASLNDVRKHVAHYATGIVLAHLLVNIVHAAAHVRLGILLGPAGTVFVISVIVFCPLLAATLLWTSYRQFGWALLALSMAGAFAFGLYNHFVAMSPDRVEQQSPGAWAAAFAITAHLLLLTEAAGSCMGAYYWSRRSDA